MKGLFYSIITVATVGLMLACENEKKENDRSQARAMYEHIISLTKKYTAKIEAAEDSASWARVCLEFEDSLDRVNFKYPADTDLLLTEGQNDTIHTLTQAYIKSRECRLEQIRHPKVDTDTIDTVRSTNEIAH